MPQLQGDPGGYAFAFEEGKLAVGQQATTLKEVRDRAATLISAAGVFAGLSTGLAFSEARFPKLTTWGMGAAIAALAGFALITISTVMIWRPFEGVFSLDSALIVGSYVEAEPPALLPEIHRELALHLGNHTAYNRIELDGRLMWFRAALAGLLVEVAGLMLAIVDAAR